MFLFPIGLVRDQDVTIQAVVHDIKISILYCSVELFLLLDNYVRKKVIRNIIENHINFYLLIIRLSLNESFLVGLFDYGITSINHNIKF